MGHTSVWNVCPTLTVLNALHLSRRHSEIFRDLISGARVFANRANLILRQLCLPAAGCSAWNVCPSHASFDGSDIRPVNAVVDRDGFGGPRISSDSPNLVARYFVLTSPLLARHVKRVVFGGSGKKVARIAARRIVAVMTYAKALGNRAFCDLISDAMRPLLSPADTENAVAQAGAARPRPTSISAAAAINQFDEPAVHNRTLGMQGSELESRRQKGGG